MSPGRRLLACALAIPLSCGALPPEPDLPDLKRGQRAAELGDVAEAERDLVPLAKMGFLQAQVSLAGLYAGTEDPKLLEQAVHWYRIAAQQNAEVAVPLARVLLRQDDPATFAEAEKFLRAADKKGDPRALAALLEFYTDHPERDKDGAIAQGYVVRAEKQNAPESENALLRWYRHNVTNPKVADALAKRCLKARDRAPECYVDLARYYRARNDRKVLAELTAAAPKRFSAGQMPAATLERMAWSLVSDGIPGEPLPDQAYPLLKLTPNSITAQVRMARLQVEYPQLDPQANPEKLLQDALAQGSLEAALALGRLYMNGTRVVADPAKAEAYLTRAASSQPAAHYYLGRIYKRGELGKAEPQRAAEHLLTAARGGYARADYLLAQLFSENRGVKPNRVNATVFAALASRNGVAESTALLQSLRANLSAAERRAADQLVEQELAARAAQPLEGQQQAANAPASAPGVQP